jgi:hypothetical protein
MDLYLLPRKYPTATDIGLPRAGPLPLTHEAAIQTSIVGKAPGTGCLKSAPGSTGTGIIAAELLDEILVPMYYAITAFDLRFRRETFPTFATDLESTRRRGVDF